VRRRDFVFLAGSIAAWPAMAPAQQLAKKARIGFLVTASQSAYASRIDAVKVGLRELGYAEGENILFDYRYADGRYDRLVGLTNELIDSGADILVTHGTPGTRAAKSATATVPIVMAISGDATSTGIVESLARPEANVTGTTFFNPELTVKRLEILMEAVPTIRRVGLILNPDNQINTPVVTAINEAAHSLGISTESFEMRTPSEFEREFSRMPAAAMDAVALTDDAVLTGNVAQIAALATTYRIPSTGFTELAAAGGLIGYGADFHQIFHRAAYFVDRLLKGSKVRELPVERSTKFDLAINLKTASTLGLAIPPILVARANQVIE
jgi:putative ABC transport system substrate-binding protein